MKIGAAPTAFQARTGEFTAPGIVTTARLKSSSEFLREVIGISLRISARRKIFLHRVNYFSIARAELSRKCVAMQNFTIAQVRSGSYRQRSRDRSEISRIARAIAQHGNSLFVSRGSR